jgi:hypothetical protein
MRKTRRNFIFGTGAALVGSAFERLKADGDTSAPAPNVHAMLQSAGYNSGGPNSALMAIIGDVHINQNPDSTHYISNFDNLLVAELNNLSPAITDLAIAGDLICYLSDSVGAGRNTLGYSWALKEYQVTKTQITRFRPDIRFYAVPGNHDTDKIEEDAETWRQQLQIPPYQKQIIGGMPVFFLNSGHAGMLNPDQIQWFGNEARLIPPDQEVIIIAHHPSFLYMFVENGLKRIVSNVFRRHRAPIWLVGGHGHEFMEGYLKSRIGAKFLQMEVSVGHPYWRPYGKPPGYILLAIQDGKLIHRSFRYVPNIGDPDPGFQIRKPLEQLTSTPLRFPFDSITYPAAVFEEGFYDRSRHLTRFVGTDLKSHLIWCRDYTVRTNLGNAKGKVSEFLLAAAFNPGVATPNIHFSATGLDGSWVAGTFPTPNHHQLYRVPIPEELRNSTALHIRFTSQDPDPYAGITISGWGLSADPSYLTAYEKWLSLHYRSLLPEARLDPNTRPPGSTLSNLEHFAFNIPLPLGVSEEPASLLAPVPPPGPPIQGGPAYSRVITGTEKTFAFARRKAANHPGISYVVEESTDLTKWNPVDRARLTVTSLDATWEEVRLTQAVAKGFFRVRLEKLSDPEGTFVPWQNSVAIPSGSAADRNGNSIDDLVEYGFDLNAADGTSRPYDPNRAGKPAGQPNIRAQGRIFSSIVFARMKTGAAPGVLYVLEQSANLSDWSPVPQSIVTERIPKSDNSWEQVECLLDDASQPMMYYRMRLELPRPLSQ